MCLFYHRTRSYTSSAGLQCFMLIFEQDLHLIAEYYTYRNLWIILTQLVIGRTECPLSYVVVTLKKLSWSYSYVH